MVARRKLRNFAVIPANHSRYEIYLEHSQVAGDSCIMTTTNAEFIAALRQHFSNCKGHCCHTKKMWFHLCPYFLGVINRYNLIMG